mgnify:CR=1 FL=1
MRTKDELFRAAQREVAAYRQQAVMQAETARRAAYAAHPALAEADSRPAASRRRAKRMRFETRDMAHILIIAIGNHCRMHQLPL